MYTENNAVLKAILRRLKKEDFLSEIKTIEQCALASRPGSKQRLKLMQLLQWCHQHKRTVHHTSPNQPPNPKHVHGA